MTIFRFDRRATMFWGEFINSAVGIFVPQILILIKIVFSINNYIAENRVGPAAEVVAAGLVVVVPKPGSVLSDKFIPLG